MALGETLRNVERTGLIKEEISPLSMLYDSWRKAKTDAFLKEHRINVNINNSPERGLIVATHPTIWDSILWRKALPKSYHAVGAPALKKTGIDWFDHEIANKISHMIPVYKGDERRQKTYEEIASLVRHNPVVFNPTGFSSASNELNEVEMIKVGGIIKIWRETGGNLSLIPAVINIDTQIKQDGTLLDGSGVEIKVGSPLKIEDIDFWAEHVDSNELKSRIYQAWKSIGVINET